MGALRSSPAVPEMQVEYFEIVDSRTLLPVEEWDEAPSVTGCITVYNGKESDLELANKL